MESRLKLLGHPIHPMLIVFPLGPLATAAVFDILYVATANDDLATFSVAVDQDANLNASNSISREGIAEVRT
ncbi:MAG TPA: DUF2231 domain-containing protein [Candidatus Limnocylindrales bacterium]|nr:DUF2231 domain-containing protein [Candidatus Limnocylindrales bacterium]